MLSSLNITNVVLIDQLTIEFKEGLCALTGETGAGKSILLDSLGLALGVRAESGLVRKGAESASVTAAFQIPENHVALKILADADITIDDDMLLMRRVISTSGKSRAFINDQPVSVALLKNVGDTLVEIHGQFDTHGLLNPQTHRDMLDGYAGIGDGLKTFWDEWKREEDALAELRKLSERSALDRDYLRTSLEDLDNLAPSQGEEAELSALRERMKHREQVLKALGHADTVLNGDNDPVRGAWGLIDKVTDKVGAAIEPAVAALARASNDMQEASRILQKICAELQEGEYDLEEIDDRLYALRMQARKHGCTVDDLPLVREDLARQFGLIEHAGDAIALQEKKVSTARKAYITEAEKISKKRRSVAEKLNKLVQAELEPLKLGKAKFVTDVETLDAVEWGASGMDRVRFLVATNPGAAAGPIHKIASGGEMSRFMLALKVVIAQAGSTHSFIFDEVDTGIGGSTADAVGERLYRLAQSKQVLVVTHAPQIAARADHHWVVEKDGAKVVKTDIRLLSARAERCEEIARMLSGAVITPEARAAADRLLSAA
jgi:DNA repair protein RecN (Recombination protein N)